MYRLSLIVCLLGLCAAGYAQSPHGEELQLDCGDCHTAASWEIPASMWQQTTNEPAPLPGQDKPAQQLRLRFDHDSTFFRLTGQHARTDCRECHPSLVFSEASSACVSCHTDVHQQTVGMDCARCHTTNNWLIDNITELHIDNGFPLLGAHASANCIDCHTSESNLRFDRIGNDCINCHLDDYQGTTSPNHPQAGFSTNCADCHDPAQNGWNTTLVDHSFFPLEKGHDIMDCTECHTSGTFSNTPTDCIACHQSDYESALSPNHLAANFSTNCTDCHTTDPDWMPAIFQQHDPEYFPIYSGGHQGEWTACIDCHLNPADFSEFTCIACHTNPETDDEHDGVGGYIYEDHACLACHPTGDADLVFDHNNTNFPLTGQHLTVQCIDCHTAGYAGTPTDCAACHTEQYDQTTNPAHAAIGISTDCATCHSTDGWMPAEFPDHDAHYPLNGAHAAIANDCAACHNGDYNNTPNTCIGCHLDDFNATTSPDHQDAQFPDDCTLCHSETAWIPASFDHNNIWPLTGAHASVPNCTDCHIGGNYTNTPNTCAGCHQPDFDGTTNPDHNAIGIPTDCETCHTTTGWMPAAFPIHDNYYQLNGAHIPIANDCAACHNGDYTNTPNTCVGCHLDDFNATTNPDHQANQFPDDCTLCHSETAWVPATFNHDDKWPLTGAHASVPNCTDCHIGGNYTNTPNTCAGCHQPDFDGTTNPDHNAIGIPTDCETCHTTTDWEPAAFPIHDNYYQLNGAHAVIASDCAACHNGDYNNTPNTCFACHEADYNATVNPNHLTAQFNTDCAICHNETAWIPSDFDHDNQYFPIYSGEHQGEWVECTDCHTNPSNYAEFTCTGCHTNPGTDNEHVGINGYVYNDIACLACHPTGDATNIFDHSSTNFPLTGQHLTVQCLECHASGFAGTPTDCAACHSVEYYQTTNPDHAAVGMPTDCENCHTPDGWSPAVFPNHDDYYPLVGAHAAIANDCEACHNGNYNNTPNTCVGCHLDNYNATTNPDHQAAQYPDECVLCHNETAWIPSSYNHDDIWPLTGAHASIPNCTDCHIGGNFSNTPNTCVGCHQPDFDATTNPDHDAIGIPTDCETCHSTDGWMPAAFPIHDNYYQLNGAHLVIANDCAACHNGNYNNTPNTCFGCHQADYNAATNPDHQANQFPENCTICHSETAWVPSTFDHETIWPLTGAHASVPNCTDCHVNGNYSNTPNTCVGCHQPDFDATTNPDHDAIGIPTDCETCHSTDGWMPAAFPIHDNYYQLNGAHLVIANDCAACHNGNYNNTPNTCFGCHQADYNAATNPDHQANQFPEDCTICHSETAWVPSSFDHETIWPLTGAHASVPNCTDCHINGNYSNTPNTCVGCHQPDFDATTNPDHDAIGIPTDCETCHSTDGWMPAAFPIHDNYYQLNGAHLVIANDCAACHNGNYNNTPNTCFGCHQADYNAATNPDHQANQFPEDCTICHSETAWVPSSFDHETIWPLTGAHASVPNCTDCHINGNYSNTPNTCVGCHQPDFDATTNPDHDAIGIPTDCETCHSTDGWMPALFPIHDNYYQLNGAHLVIANDCAACHNGNYNNTPNTCFGCHQADYNAATNPDHQANQFPEDCTICHSETAWVPSSFDHETIWPLTGAHASVPNCTDCHVNGNYSNTPNTCVGCHQPDFDATTNPDHDAIGIPTDCETCHSTDGWMPALFPIHDNYYQLNGAHLVIANDCAACHNGNYNNTPNTCFGCHQADYNAATNPDHQANQFPEDCTICHSETAWVPSSFDHETIWPLTGAHASVPNCTDCHVNGNYSNTPNTCVGCHQPDFDATTNPDHDAIGIPTDCETCHSTDGWMPALFPIHDNYYQLNGAHIPIANDCAACHNGDYNNTPNTCVGCHLDDYQAAANPDHSANQFPTNCTQCHNEAAWVPSTFDHNTVWPLNGAHANVPNCTDCHLAGNYNNIPNTCYGCHQDDYSGATNPNHITNQFPTDCTQCHDENAWIPSTFDHNTVWPLTGAHAGVPNCTDCHINGNYNNTPNTCAGCHQPDYNASTNPNHVVLGIPTTCEDCHTPDAWEPALFPIHDNYYQLNGAHLVIANDCVACHNGNYNNTPNTCVGCHIDDYNATSNPNHAANQFSTDCTQCHNEDAWVPSTFDHNTVWPLNGAHANVPNCTDCHIGGNYNNTPNTCYGCHQDDYNNTNNPDHQVAGFPTDCTQCHNENAWIPSTWDHDNLYFPIYSGRHEGEWTLCSECHTTPNNYTAFSCIDCHAHDDPVQAGDDHQGVPGYVYSSPACYACHPDGEK